MRMSIDALEALIEEVESQGGALLPEEHMPEDVEYKIEDGYIRDVTLKNFSSGCGHQARLVSIYDPQLEKRHGGSGFVTACAVCDSMGHWPRYAEAVYAADPDLRPPTAGEDADGDDD